MMKKLFFVVLTLLSSSAYAEVFKCQLDSGKTVYQPTPCEAAVKQQTIEIQKPDPRKIAEEKAKLKAWEEDYAKREEARIKVEKEQQIELDRRASVEALKKSAEYQQQQAYEAKRQADALERQSTQPIYQPYQFYPSYPTYQSIPTLPTLPPVMSLPPPVSPFPTAQPFPTYPSSVPHQHNIKEKTGKDTDGNNDDSNSLLRGYR